MILFLMLIGFLMQPPATGEVHGRVDLVESRSAGTPRTSARYARGRTESSGVREAVPVVVWIEGADPLARPTSTPPVLNQKDTKFEPRLVVVVAGQSVRVLNSDPIYHNVFSLSDVKRFNVGRRPAGEYVDIRFDKPGEVPVFCDIHSSMTATIRVLPPNTNQWVVLDGGGDFRLQNLPPGRYTVHTAAPGYAEQRRNVVIAGGQRVGMDTITLEP